MQSLHEHTGLNRKAYDTRMLLPKRVERTMRQERNKRPNTVPYATNAKLVNDRVRASKMARCPTGLCVDPDPSGKDLAGCKATFEADEAARKQAGETAYASWLATVENSADYRARRRWVRTEAHRDDQLHAMAGVDLSSSR